MCTRRFIFHPHLRCAALAAKVKHASDSPIIVLSHIASRAAHLAFLLKAVKSRNTREKEQEESAAEPRSRLGALFSRGEMSALAVHARQDGKYSGRRRECRHPRNLGQIHL